MWFRIPDHTPTNRRAPAAYRGWQARKRQRPIGGRGSDVIYGEEGLEAGGVARSIRNQLMAELGLSFFLPTTFREK